MVQRQIDKVGATLLLEATKAVLELLGRWSIESGHGGGKPEGLSQSYASVRRLRDYLQRAISAYPTRVSLDLAEMDENLLASCAIHYMGDLEVLLRSPTTPPKDRELHDGKVRTLAELAVGMARGRVARIPVPSGRPNDPPMVREVLTAIARGAAEIGSRAQGVNTGLAHFQSPGGAPAARPEARRPGPAAATPAATQPGGSGAAAPAFDRSPSRPQAPGAYEPSPVSAFADSAGPGLPATGMRGPGMPAPGIPEPGMPSATVLDDEHEDVQLLDPRRVRDPRLRAMIAMDQGAYARGKSSKHYRLAMIHLSSILEGVVVDYAIPRRRDLGLIGSPETWKIADVVTTILGDRLTIKDRPCLVQLIAGRNLVRPAIQLNSPLAVTADSLRQNEAFVRRVLAELGFTGSAEPGAGDAPV